MNKERVLVAVLVIALGVCVVVLIGRRIEMAPKPVVRSWSYVSSTTAPETYCDGAVMDSEGYKKTLTVEHALPTPVGSQTLEAQVQAVLAAATTGMCQQAVTTQSPIINQGVVTMAPIEGWAGVSITMCSCRPLVEANLLRIPGITQVMWP